jgi:hypothetical protein
MIIEYLDDKFLNIKKMDDFELKEDGMGRGFPYYYSFYHVDKQIYNSYTFETKKEARTWIDYYIIDKGLPATKDEIFEMYKEDEEEDEWEDNPLPSSMEEDPLYYPGNIEEDGEIL